ncbi:MAG: single-stranded-DNA-specific exonuclease RecJ, partial [Cyclobacteriaceae bacterium]|nr:single-stranded-DNA-specific exonuclease RecJ [Cyclobacteriaceae bacterium]
MTKRWIFNDDIDEDVVAQLSREINVSPIIAKILIQRNINDFDQAKRYFRPSLDQLHDPFLMRDMDKALERIKTAMDL